MITLHHLNNSRSQRILWLLEELETPYEIVKHQRDPETRLAPDSLKAIHPLGKSPVIVDADRTIAESGAIIDYLIRNYGDGGMMPVYDTPDYDRYMEWLHFGEGSAMLPFILALYVSRLGEAGAPLQPRIQSEIASHLGYMAKELGDKPFFVGNNLTGADIQLIFVLEAAATTGALAAFENLTAYMGRIQARAAYQRALEVGGPYQLGR